FFVKGAVQANIKGLVQIDLKASTSEKAEGDANAAFDESAGAQFIITGKITAQGLSDKFGVKFSKDPSVTFWAKSAGGEITYGMDDFSTSIVGIKGVDEVNIDLAASYAKDKGFNASIVINKLKVKMFKLGGSLSIKESKFEKAGLTVEADIPGV